MNSFSDKPIFTLKQLAGVVLTAVAIGGGIARFEMKSTVIETKLDNIIVYLHYSKVESNRRFLNIESDLLIANSKIQAVTTSLTAMLKPEEITFKRR